MAITDQAGTGITEDTIEGTSATGMQVQKRDGSLQSVDVNKIVKAVERCATELPGVDPMRIATRTISGLHDGATTTELDELSIRTAAALIIEEPNYSRLAARLLGTFIEKKSRIKTFTRLVNPSSWDLSVG